MLPICIFFDHAFISGITDVWMFACMYIVIFWLGVMYLNVFLEFFRQLVCSCDYSHLHVAAIRPVDKEQKNNRNYSDACTWSAHRAKFQRVINRWRDVICPNRKRSKWSHPLIFCTHNNLIGWVPKVQKQRQVTFTFTVDRWASPHKYCSGLSV